MKIHARNKKLSGEIDLKELAHLTFFYSSVTLAKILNEAAIIQHFAGHDVITQEDLDEAHRNFRFGFRNSEMCHNSTDERHAVSIHELGHAFCSKNKIKEISIISRSSSSGYTWYAEENPSYVTANVLKNRIIELLGGRAAEKVVLGVVSTGAKNDIERALDIACDYIAKYGMSNSMGLLCINSESVDESMKKEILSEARKMMSELFEEAIKIVVKNKEAIIKISEVLEEKEIISGEEFYKLLKKYSI